MYCFFSSPPSLVRSSYWRFPSLYSVFYCPSLSAEPASCSQGVPPPSKFLLVILCVVPAGSLHLLLCGEREGCCFFIMLSLHIALCAVCCVQCAVYSVYSAHCTLYSVLCSPPLRLRFLLFSSSARETRNSKLETRDGRFGKREDFGFYRRS